MERRSHPGLLLLRRRNHLVAASPARPAPDAEATIPGLTAAAIERVFATTFPEHHTVLVGGGDEPLYEPPAEGLGRIIYRADYPASALHEVAHWCVAGARRREQLDYGYWYAPDGRSPEQQAEFEVVEVKPQALEWVFAEAAGVRFVPSADNVEAGCGPSEAFVAALERRRAELLGGALRGRALAFRNALAAARQGLKAG